MSTQTLMLTPWMAPHRVISWQRAIVLLYLAGRSAGRYAGFRGWTTGLAMVAIGVVLVAITMALGG